MKMIEDFIFEGDIESTKKIVLEQLREKAEKSFEDMVHPSTTIDDEILKLNEERDTLLGEDGSVLSGKEEDFRIISKKISEKNSYKLGTIFEDVETDDPERDAVIKITAAARGFGGDEPAYDQGLLYVELRSKQAAQEFSDWLEDCDFVEGYEMEINHVDRWKGFEEDMEIDFDEITNDINFYFDFSVYLNPEIVQYDSYTMYVDEEISEDNGNLSEVTRKIKINFRGKKRVKMKCARGFKWDPEKKACVKIAGADLAQMRKSLRRAVLTKRSKGAGYKARVARKSKKAKRFRKMMGLK